MSRLLIRIRLVVLLLVISGSYGAAQSRNAYLNAGDACMEKQDPFCARSCYLQALDYGDDATTFLKLALAEKKLFNYREALNRIRKAMSLASTTEDKQEILLVAADLYKRTGDYPIAIQCIDSLLQLNPAKKELWQQLMFSYRKAQQYAGDSTALDVIPAEGDINSAYSDFAPAMLGDSILYYSSLRHQINDGQTRISTSRIAEVPVDRPTTVKSRLLPETINQVSFNDANASISPDGKLMIFTRCLYNDQGTLICSLYESKFENGKWKEAVKLPDEINSASATATQPCIATNKSEGYILYFSSNRRGGKGSMDIWTSKRGASGKWQKPENAGAAINTSGDEWSPFYDAANGTLTFSSERDSGLGGLDLWQYDTNTPLVAPKHLPVPYNSGYNDLYFTRSYGEKNHRFLVSNRPPAAKLNGSSCCYDIFLLNDRPVRIDTILTVPTDSGLVIAAAPTGTDNTQLNTFISLSPAEQIKVLNTFFPIRLYFDNDHPDPRSVSRTTNKVYDDLATAYLNRTDDYLKNQSTRDLEAGIRSFFEDSVATSLQRLETFSRLFEAMLQQYSGKVKITITGSASPLAESRYNVILSNRRIVSLENYWKNRATGKIKDALMHQTLIIQFIPAGEEQSASGVSDDLRDPSKSVYSREAALERRIELTAIELIP